MLDTLSSGANANVKRGVKQELALPLKLNLLVNFQDTNVTNRHQLPSNDI